jgi:hypothetical protein
MTVHLTGKGVIGYTLKVRITDPIKHGDMIALDQQGYVVLYDNAKHDELIPLGHVPAGAIISADYIDFPRWFFEQAQIFQLPPKDA